MLKNTQVSLFLSLIHFHSKAHPIKRTLFINVIKTVTLYTHTLANIRVSYPVSQKKDVSKEKC
jgi:hypothetical protein